MTASSEQRGPILKELVPIVTSKERGHTILIDEAREFVGVWTVTRLWRS